MTRSLHLFKQRLNDSTIGVLIVTGAYPPEVSGGGRQCHTLIQTLCRRVRFLVLTTTVDKKLPSSEMKDGVLITRILIRPGSLQSKLTGICKIIQFFYRYHSYFQIIQLHGMSQKNFLLVLLARLTGKRIIQKMTSAGQDDPISLHRRKWGFLALPLFVTSDCIISVSPALSELYVQKGLRRNYLREIPNGVDLERFRPAHNKEERCQLRARLGFSEGQRLIIYAGFFSKDKGPDILAEAWVKARKRLRMSPKLIFIGSRFSPYYEIDKEVITKVNEIVAEVREEVQFIESTQIIEQWFRIADCFVLSSWREGLPNALLEAMATALPCIVSHLPGITDTVVTNGVNGYLIPPGDVSGFAEAIVGVLQDPINAAQLGKAARKTVEIHFAIQDVAKSYETLYGELV